uniref:Uncharacterized protein n=1 Tax=Zea mays TaxID=4577 RepID=A0A804MIX7_MAIZE
MSMVTLVVGREQKARSWVFITSSAASALDTTSVGTSPRRRNMRGPCRRDSSIMVRCPRPRTTWWMLPMTGRVHGPGGSRRRERQWLSPRLRACETKGGGLSLLLGKLHTRW